MRLFPRFPARKDLHPAEKPVVLFVSHTGMWGGGAEVVLEQMLRATRAIGYAPYLVAPSGGLVERLGQLCDRVEVVDVPWVKRPQLGELYSIPYLCASWAVGVVRLIGVLRRSHARVIHANSGVAALVACFPATLLNRPLVWHQHDLVPRRLINGVVLGLCGRMATIVLATSQAVSESLGALGVSPCRRVVLYPCIRPVFEATPPDRAAARRDLHLPSDDFLATVIGRLVPRKGQAVLLQALAHVDDADRCVHGLVVGDPTPGDEASVVYAAKLREMAEWPALRGRVHFHSRCEDVQRILAASNVLIVTSFAEPLGITVLEAFATGVPVIAAASGGPLELIRQEETGLLVPPGDVTALAEAIRRLMTDEALRTKIVANAARVVRQRFLERNLESQLTPVYSALAGTAKACNEESRVSAVVDR